MTKKKQIKTDIQVGGAEGYLQNRGYSVGLLKAFGLIDNPKVPKK